MLCGGFGENIRHRYRLAADILVYMSVPYFGVGTVEVVWYAATHYLWVKDEGLVSPIPSTSAIPCSGQNVQTRVFRNHRLCACFQMLFGILIISYTLIHTCEVETPVYTIEPNKFH